MQIQLNTDGIIRARYSAATTLLKSLRYLSDFSERELANKWLKNIEDDSHILPYGWYQPPPRGVSILIGNPPKYDRLYFESLRSEENWPRIDIRFSSESVLYPYFSAIDRSTFMIGDHVGTYYSGKNIKIQDWIRRCYRCTLDIAEGIESGMTYSDVYAFGNEKLRSLGASNNNYSISQGLASDIGHTIPFFVDNAQMTGIFLEQSEKFDLDFSHSIAVGREFICATNQRVVQNPCAFTIEPQILVENLPMVGFHIIVVFSDRGKLIIENYDELFDHFGMSQWIRQ